MNGSGLPRLGRYHNEESQSSYGQLHQPVTKGTLVGMMDVEYDGTTAIVALTTDSPYKMDATHVYVDHVKQDTIAPGQFTSVKDGDNLTSALHQINGLSGGQIYFSAHAEVCGF